MTVRHKNLTDPAIHEPKGASAAASGAVYVANGTGSGAWSNELTELEDVQLKAANAKWTDAIIPVNSITVPAALTATTLTKIADDAAGTSRGVFLPNFSAAATNDIVGALQLPHGYIAGTAIKPHVHWSGSATSAGNVRWEFEYLITNKDEAFTDSVLDAQTIAFGGTANIMQIDGFTEIPGTNLRESTVVMIRLSRMGADGADTYAGTVFLHGFDFHIQIEKLGSTDEYPGA